MLAFFDFMRCKNLQNATLLPFFRRNPHSFVVKLWCCMKKKLYLLKSIKMKLCKN